MTEPTRVGEVLPGVLAEVVERAGHGYQRSAELVVQAATATTRSAAATSPAGSGFQLTAPPT
jgi:hypothetical protein